MKTFIFFFLLGAAAMAHGQGVLVIDQQSGANPPGNFGPGNFAYIQDNQPFGQSFTPSLSTIGYVQLNLGDINTANGLGATIFINLLANSITGPQLAASTSAILPNGYGRPGSDLGITTFYFDAPVTLSPGTTYYLNVRAQSGSDAFGIDAYTYGYSGGRLFYNGQPASSSDALWFREGIVVVPEPSTFALFVICAGSLLYAVRKSPHKCLANA